MTGLAPMRSAKMGAMNRPAMLKIEIRARMYEAEVRLTPCSMAKGME